MVSRAIVGLTLLAAIVQGVAPEVGMMVMLPLVLVVLGLAYAALEVDAENATDVLVVAVAAGAASGADVLSMIPAVGMYLDGILDGVVVALYAGVATVVALRLVNRIKG